MSLNGAKRRGHPVAITEVGHVEGVPRRIRAMLGNRAIADSTSAVYVWEHPYYPAFYLPEADIDAEVLAELDAAGQVHRDDAVPDHVKLAWDALDAWFEEDEQVYVHPRSPYVRVDALRSTRSVRVELDGIVLAESSAPVMLFETGLPTRYYLDRQSVRWEHLVPTETQTPCPYKGRTSDYWSVRVGDALHEDLAWSYDYPTPAVAPITGLIAFYNEKVDIFVDGVELHQPRTKFS